MTTEPTFRLWRKETHYATIEFTLSEIQEMMAGHIVDSERIGDDRLSDAELVQRFVDQVNSGLDFPLTDMVNCGAEVDPVPSDPEDWDWDEWS